MILYEWISVFLIPVMFLIARVLMRDQNRMWDSVDKFRARVDYHELQEYGTAWKHVDPKYLKGWEVS